MQAGLTRGNLLNLRGDRDKPQQAEFLLLRLLVSHYRQSLDRLVIFQDIYGYQPQSNLEDAIATNLAGIRTKYLVDPEPNTSDLRGFGLMGIYLLTGLLPGQLRVSRETGEIFWDQFWDQYRGEIDSELGDLLDQALYCTRRDRLPTGQRILQALQLRLKAPASAVPRLDSPLPLLISPEKDNSFPVPSWTKPLIYGNLVVGASIALGLVMARQFWQPKPISQAEMNPSVGKTPAQKIPTVSPPPSKSPVGARNLPASPLRSPIIAATPSPNLEVGFQGAIATAQQALILEQLPQKKWPEIAPLWQRAVQQMRSVPATSPNYALAQKKIKEYQTYLSYAQQQFDPFVAGMQEANQAVKVGKTAQSRNQWQQASGYWQQAIAQLQAVPKSHNNYQTAQGKIKEYQRYQASVQTKLLELDISARSSPKTSVATNPGKMTLVRTIRGDISPKSIVHSGAGLFFAQNMMYRHTITVYNRSFELVKTISDRIQLSNFGHKGYSGSYQGSPVEAAFSQQGKYAWVSNYEMSGAGFNHPGQDVCSPGAKYDPSFVYRIDTGSLQIDRAIKVGSVPKYTAVSPDDRYLLVTNWCSWDLSLVDTQKSQEIQRINLGAYPRGIAIDSKSQKAYIAVMGSLDVAVLNLQNLSLNWLRGLGNAPRHVNISPDDQYLYISFNGEGKVGKIDLKTGKVIKKISTGRSPRSMTLSANGEFLYVVNYDSQSFSKVRTRDMEVIETIPVEADPIGITYDSATKQVWVACYSGSLWIFQD